jgi:hypothetical protein
MTAIDTGTFGRALAIAATLWVGIGILVGWLLL